MRLLIDISVLLDVALQRPGAPASARLLASCGRQHEGWLAWHSIATLAYLVERQTSATSGPELIRGMLAWADVAKTGRADALAALELPMRDFKASPVPALNPEAFLRRHPCPPADVDQCSPHFRLVFRNAEERDS